MPDASATSTSSTLTRCHGSNGLFKLKDVTSQNNFVQIEAVSCIYAFSKSILIPVHLQPIHKQKMLYVVKLDRVNQHDLKYIYLYKVKYVYIYTQHISV